MLVSSTQQSESCLLSGFRFLSWVGCHRVLSRVPCSHSGFSLVTYFHIAVRLCQPRSPHIPLLLLILWKFVFYIHDSTSVLWRSSLYPFLLDSTYKQYHMLFVFLCLTYFTQYEKSLGSFMLLQMTLFCSFYGWVTFHPMDVPHLLYPFLCCWTFRLFLYFVFYMVLQLTLLHCCWEYKLV